MNINKASLKELTTLPGIGTKYAQTIVSMKELKGTIVIDDFHETPALQTKLHELSEKKLVSSEHT